MRYGKKFELFSADLTKRGKHRPKRILTNPGGIAQLTFAHRVLKLLL